MLQHQHANAGPVCEWACTTYESYETAWGGGGVALATTRGAIADSRVGACEGRSVGRFEGRWGISSVIGRPLGETTLG